MRSKVQDKASILKLIQQNRHRIAAFGVSKISLFGSFLTGKITTKSDVDFLVEFNPGMKTYDNFMELSFFLEDILGRKVEIVTPQSLSPYMSPYIMQQAEYVQI